MAAKSSNPPNPTALAPNAIDAWQDLMSEWGRFITMRLQEDAETQRALMACKTPTDLMRIQTEFYQTAIRQYSEASMRLAQKAADAAGQSVPGAGHGRKYDDIPL